MSRPSSLFIIGVCLYAVAMKVMPYGLENLGVEIEPGKTFYPWNFSPMTACCLFGAAYLANRTWAYLLPIAVLFAGDLGIWAFRPEYAFHEGTLVVYGSFVLIAILGTKLRERRTLGMVWGLGIAGECLFFLITNFAIWLSANPETAVPPFVYTKDVAGLLQCYTMALPFFGKSLASTLFFTTVLFSPYLYRERKAAAVPAQARTFSA